MTRSTERWLPLAFVTIVGGLAVLLQAPPSPLPATAPVDRFSADRAMKHVEIIAREPHPVESKAAEAVRTYLVGELESLGLATEIQARQDLSSANVMASCAGPARQIGRRSSWRPITTRSTTAPARGDDASGVAAILEALRALKEAPHRSRRDCPIYRRRGGLRHPIPWLEYVRGGSPMDQSRRVGPELRGSRRRRASFLFETSDRNGRLIREFSRGAEHPLGTSLAYAVYKLMPNDTDLSIFKKAGLKGLNFAFVGRVDRYHTPQDTPQNLDRGSLQHHGSYALSLARHFGNLDLDHLPDEPDAIYFPVFGPHLIVYPAAWALAFMLTAVIAWNLVVTRGLRRRALSPKGLVLGVFLALAAPDRDALGGLGRAGRLSIDPRDPEQPDARGGPRHPGVPGGDGHLRPGGMGPRQGVGPGHGRAVLVALAHGPIHVNAARRELPVRLARGRRGDRRRPGDDLAKNAGRSRLISDRSRPSPSYRQRSRPCATPWGRISRSPRPYRPRSWSSH